MKYLSILCVYLLLASCSGVQTPVVINAPMGGSTTNTTQNNSQNNNITDIEKSGKNAISKISDSKTFSVLRLKSAYSEKYDITISIGDINISDNKADFLIAFPGKEQERFVDISPGKIWVFNYKRSSHKLKLVSIDAIQNSAEFKVIDE